MPISLNTPADTITGETVSAWLQDFNIILSYFETIENFVNLMESEIGFPLANLNTTDKSSVIAALNEVAASSGTISSIIGSLSALTTTANLNIVLACQIVYLYFFLKIKITS